MTYDQIVEILKSNHFYPVPVKQNGKIIELHIESPALITMEDKKNRLEEVLKDCGVKISEMRNEGYLLIKKKK